MWRSVSDAGGRVLSLHRPLNIHELPGRRGGGPGHRYRESQPGFSRTYRNFITHTALNTRHTFAPANGRRRRKWVRPVGVACAGRSFPRVFIFFTAESRRGGNFHRRSGAGAERPVYIEAPVLIVRPHESRSQKQIRFQFPPFTGILSGRHLLLLTSAFVFTRTLHGRFPVHLKDVVPSSPEPPADRPPPAAPEDPPSTVCGLCPWCPPRYPHAPTTYGSRGPSPHSSCPDLSVSSTEADASKEGVWPQIEGYRRRQWPHHHCVCRKHL
ncbi:unnamed protein product [Pleuronectes platessa]|uniref:Uncharacterized protein n=1 Tax=Pleuronectes platessa TaxID=8262 RepID=A0A9N7VG41_PLEPL|nr:unnamed protein product [Pleuronectes platessa]